MNQLSERHAVWGMVVSSSGSTLFATGACFLSKWDLSTGVRLGSAYVRERVAKIVLSSDEKTLYLGASEQNGVLLWYSASTLERLDAVKAHSNFIKALVLLPKSNLLISGSADRNMIFWDAKTLEKQLTLSKHRDWVWTIAFDRSESTIFSGGSDRELLEHSLPRGETVKRIVMPEWVMSVALSPDEETLFVGGQKKLFLVERKNGKILKNFAAHSQPIFSTFFEKKNNAIVSCSGDGNVSLSLVDNLQEQVIVSQHSDQVYSVLVVGDTIISAGCDKKIIFASLSSAVSSAKSRKKVQEEVQKNPAGAENLPELQEPMRRGHPPGLKDLPEPKTPAGFEEPARLDDSCIEAPLRITCLLRPESTPDSCAFLDSNDRTTISEANSQAKKKRKQFGSDWVSGIFREGKFVTHGSENLEMPLFFRGAERLIIGFRPDGLIQTDSGETFEINYELEKLELKGKEDLF